MDIQTLPIGFQTSGVTAGIKESKLPDLSLFVSKQPSVAVGVFTQNQVVGAPVIVSRERVPSTTARAVVINSGNANACTGDRGLNDAKRMTSIVAEELSVAETDVLVCSTGIIGHCLPMEVVANGVRSAVNDLEHSEQALLRSAKGIMTTDTVEKIASCEVSIDGQTVIITGVAKGAAMIAPNMATMLAVIMTDAQLSDESAATLLKSSVDASFNCISVEGHTSTSDTVLLLANGESGVNCDSGEAQQSVEGAINEVCQTLAQKIIRDAEGAQHFVEVEVTGMPDQISARKVAKVVCESPLVKTAITGNDPNWGRIVSAAGYSGVVFQEKDLSLSLNGVIIYEWGHPTVYDETALSQSMKSGEVNIHLEFRLGTEQVTYWTCDLTTEYIHLNADYTT